MPCSGHTQSRRYFKGQIDAAFSRLLICNVCAPTPGAICLIMAVAAVRLQVNGRIMRKRIHVRIEHVQPSRCREDFLRRRETNDRIKHEAKVKGGETKPQIGWAADG